MEIIKATILDLSALRKLELECFGKDAWPLFDLIAVLTFAEVISCLLYTSPSPRD